MNNRTNAYRFTVQTLDNPHLTALRMEIKIANAKAKVFDLENPDRPARPRFRIKVRGRLGKNSPHRHLYRRGGAYYRWSSQDIRPEHSERFDVYVHYRYS